MDVKTILNKIQDLYDRSSTAITEVPLGLQAHHFEYLARSYVGAASVVERHAPHHWLPIVQLTGQAVELSLKACLASAGVTPPASHDLVDLYHHAATLGFHLDARMFAVIVHLQHMYFEDLGTGKKFKSRYPAKRNERLGGSLSNNSEFTSIVDALLDQAKQRRTGDGAA